MPYISNVSETLHHSPVVENPRSPINLPRLNFGARLSIATIMAGGATLLLPPEIPPMIIYEASKIAADLNNALPREAALAALNTLPKTADSFVTGVTQGIYWSLGAIPLGGLVSDLVSDLRKKSEERVGSPAAAIGSGLGVAIANGLFEVARMNRM